MMPLTMPKVSCRTLTTGARQFVVQQALEMTLCLAASYLSSFTPRTMVTSSLVAGAEMMTFLTVVPRWALALVASVKRPVDSTTICAPTEAQSSLAGSRSAKTLIFLPSTEMKSSPCGDVVLQIAKDGIVFEQMSERCRAGEVVYGDKIDLGIAERGAKTLRPMRPKPLMPTFTAMIRLLSCYVIKLVWTGSSRHGHDDVSRKPPNRRY